MIVSELRLPADDQAAVFLLDVGAEAAAGLTEAAAYPGRVLADGQARVAVVELQR